MFRRTLRSTKYEEGQDLGVPTIVSTMYTAMTAAVLESTLRILDPYLCDVPAITALQVRTKSNFRLQLQCSYRGHVVEKCY